MSKRKQLNRCGTCRYFKRFVIKDAYGEKYQVCKCLNPKSERDIVRAVRGACRRWSKKRMPNSGDFCYYLGRKIYYEESTPKTKIPCFSCVARCVFAVRKNEKDFTQTHQKKVFISEVMDEMLE